MPDRAAYEPRLGITWAPAKSGNTTLRASGGIFHGWLDPGIWWQTVRSDSQHQRDIIITNPSYPDPGPGGLTSPANTYVLGEYKLNKNVRYSAGVDQRFSPRASVNVLYNYYHQDQLPRGTNLNPSIGGVRPNPAFGNIISTVTDAEILRHELFVNFNLNLMKPSPTAANATFNWRRLAANGSYSYIRARRNAIGPFDVPASGTLETEWGTRSGRQPLPGERRGDEHAAEESVGQPVAERVRRISVHGDDRIRRQPRRPAQRPSGRRRHLDASHHPGLVGEHAVHLQPPAPLERREGRGAQRRHGTGRASTSPSTT